MPKLHEHIQIDDEADIVTLYGIRYSGEIFRGLGFDLRPGQSFKILKREDGVITIQTARDEPQAH
jgi:hypothetical protein